MVTSTCWNLANNSDKTTSASHLCGWGKCPRSLPKPHCSKLAVTSSLRLISHPWGRFVPKEGPRRFPSKKRLRFSVTAPDRKTRRGSVAAMFVCLHGSIIVCTLCAESACVLMHICDICHTALRRKKQKVNAVPNGVSCVDNHTSKLWTLWRHTEHEENRKSVVFLVDRILRLRSIS